MGILGTLIGNYNLIGFSVVVFVGTLWCYLVMILAITGLFQAIDRVIEVRRSEHLVIKISKN